MTSPYKLRIEARMPYEHSESLMQIELDIFFSESVDHFYPQTEIYRSKEGDKMQQEQSIEGITELTYLEIEDVKQFALSVKKRIRELINEGFTVDSSFLDVMTVKVSLLDLERWDSVTEVKGNE